MSLDRHNGKQAHTKEEFRLRAGFLAQRQAWPLAGKVRHTQETIRAWVRHFEGNVSVSFSGGLDSTVLLHIVRGLYPDVPAVFVDTGMEFPEIRQFAKPLADVVLRPIKPFARVVIEDGWPVVSKDVAGAIYDVQRNAGPATVNMRMTGYTGKGTYLPNFKIPECHKYLIDAPFKVSDKCCHMLKTGPLDRWLKETGRRPMSGERAEESRRRQRTWVQYGCNMTEIKQPRSTPLAFWTHADILEYIRVHGLPYCPIYDMGYERTGCFGCLFGVHRETAKGQMNRIERLRESHPKLWEWLCLKVGAGEVLDFMGVPWGKDGTRQNQGVML